jgi:hypothetical protein
VRATDGGGKGHGRRRWERLYRPSARLFGFDLAFQASASWQTLLAGSGALIGRLATSRRGMLATALASSLLIGLLALWILSP